MTTHHLSKVLYIGMCEKIGTQRQVALRREVADVEEIIRNQINRSNVVKMKSGSEREGFKLKGSDVDTMYWPNDFRVIWDPSQLYQTTAQKRILCDSSKSRPGFVLLLVPKNGTFNPYVSEALSPVQGSVYSCLSSAKYRKIMLHSVTPNSKPHGPCSSGKLGQVEYDDVHCFFSDDWPSLASSWAERCRSWPPVQVVEKIISNGCHFVAIGHTPDEENEWRISFSQAENKLVYSMNHSQFLTYGLLKLFLKDKYKEVDEKDKLLCSYHMKTVVFWAIQQNAIRHWYPQHLLEGFWVCFKLLLKWVYVGVCPNFFIPENNMFLSKVYGEKQKTLFQDLYRLYEQGISFLLQLPSVGPFFLKAFTGNPRFSVLTEEDALIPEDTFDKDVFSAIAGIDTSFPSDLSGCLKTLDTIELLRESTRYPILPKVRVDILQNTAFLLQNMFNKLGNKKLYIADKISCKMLKLAAKKGFVSDVLFISLYFFSTLRFKDCLFYIDEAKKRLSQDFIMYRRGVKSQKYIDAVGGLSWFTKMRKALARDITLDNKISYIKELSLEQQSGLQDRRSMLDIPPFVILYMLEFLCCIHNEESRARQALENLRNLINNGALVPTDLRDIYWQILGICQYATGNLPAAKDSFNKSLEEFKANNIEKATKQRINEIDLNNLLQFWH